MKITQSGAEIIISQLQAHGIDTVSGIPGGANLPLYDALGKSSMKHILVRHEQSAGFIAQGMARSTGKPAVCFATSGPGAMNLLTAIADAKMDSTPIIAITGQVASPLIGTDAFQEIDTFGLSIPITKHNYLARSAEELLEIIPEAFRIATSGRPGPVLIDVPKDVQQQMHTYDNDAKAEEPPKKTTFDLQHMDKLKEWLKEAKRPMAIIGGGIIQGHATDALKAFAEKLGLPLTTTLMGRDAISTSHTLHLGMLGMHGAPYVNYALHEADLVLALGIRFDDRAIGNASLFCPDAKLAHIDIDPAEISKIKDTHLNIIGDLKTTLETLTHDMEPLDTKEWLATIADKAANHPMPSSIDEKEDHPVSIIKKINGYADKDAIITTDVGQHQMWVAQHYAFHTPRSFLTSGGLGTMGFGLPTAIGAALANPDKQIICFSGDGSILMNIQELATLNDLKLNIKVIILNNKQLGLVRQQQELFYQKNYTACQFISTPNFSGVANEFGLDGYEWEDLLQSEELMAAIWKNETPAVINIPISDDNNVLPMVAPGAANIDMIGG